MWLVGVVSRRWVWLVGEGGIYGCGCKEVYRFPHTTYLVSVLFLQQHPYFLFIFLIFFNSLRIYYRGTLVPGLSGCGRLRKTT